MRTLLDMFLFATWVIRGLTCETFPSTTLACLHAMSVTLRIQELPRDVCHVCAHMLHIPSMTSLVFAHNANQISMMSLGFVFHSHHVLLRWHDIIGVHIVRKPHRHNIIMVCIVLT